MNDDGLLAEQRAYYRARAPEYDEWWQRRGRYDRGSGLAEEWDRQAAQVAAALETFGPGYLLMAALYFVRKRWFGKAPTTS